MARIYFRGGAYPTQWQAFRYFGPTAARFDHHLPAADGVGQIQDRGIFYASHDATTCFAEVFQAPVRLIDRKRHNPWLVVFVLQSDLHVLDLTGKFAVRVGASMKLASGPIADSRNWSRGFYEAYPDILGIQYPSSLTNAPVVALYERADNGRIIPLTPVFHRALNDPAMLSIVINVADDLGYGLS